ncbi:MAG: PEP-CTERM sorting domain-containing protein [Akkermansia sp.]|nr:PEP-CTERM sorting domain-containing protein [Akkermansia sp.]
MTLSFVGENTILVNGSGIGGISGLDLYTRGPLAVIGDSSAKEYWYTALTSEDIKSVTLASTTSSFGAPSAKTSFEGLAESGSITLGNATVDYMGYHEVTTAAEAEALITGDNQIALVAIKGTKELALVGKISGATTPEPATATLSLLALAGLASRRRRK